MNTTSSADKAPVQWQDEMYALQLLNKVDMACSLGWSLLLVETLRVTTDGLVSGWGA
jgi:hypothetical protein